MYPNPMDTSRGLVAHVRARRHPELEQRDFCSLTDEQVIAIAQEPCPRFAMTRTAPLGSSVAHGGKVLKDIKGMGRVYDWRTSGWSQPNGGKITPLVFVQHIPVVPNMAGIADFVRLRDVLVAQGLMVQNATDRDGNVALYTPMDRLCYQAKGANQQSCGTEHMHMSIGEDWTKHQLRASAWIVNLALTKHNIPAHQGTLASGPGIIRVSKRGQTTHMRVATAAGFFNRTDPGSKYDFEYVYSCVVKWRARIADGTADSKGMEGF